MGFRERRSSRMNRGHGPRVDKSRPKIRGIETGFTVLDKVVMSCFLVVLDDYYMFMYLNYIA